MKTKCMSCEGTMKKMQNGGLITGAKKVPKQGPIKTINTIRKDLKKLTPRKTVPGCFGASCGKMQKGGVTRPIPGQKKPVTREYKITRAMTNGVKSPNLPPLDSKYLKKRSTGLILKDKSKFPEGIYKPTMQTGGFPITAKAAARKVAKGKGMMTYNYGTKDVPGSDGNKGAYVKFAKDQKPNPYGGKTLQGRSRRVMKKGGVKK